VNRFIPKQMYIRIFLSLCILFILVSIPFVYMMTHQFSVYAMRQIDKINKTEIAHSRDNAQFIFNKLISYGLTMYADKSIQAWMTSGDEFQEKQVEAIAAAAKYMTTEPFLDNVYMVNMRTKHVLDLKFGIASFEQFHDQDMLDRVSQPRSSYLRLFVHRMNGTSQLALIIPTVPSGQTSFSYLALLLNDTLMQQYLLKEDPGSEIRSFILDSSGQVMLGPPGYEDLYAEFAVHSTEAGSGSFTQTYDGESWSVQYALIEPQGWTIYHMAKLEGIHADFNSFRVKMVIFVAGLIALLIIILFWNSRRTYKPFSQLAHQLETKFGMPMKPAHKESSMAEYSVIRHGIEIMEDRMGQLDSSMREHRNVIKAEYLKQWILQGKLVSPVERYLHEHSGLFQHEGLYIAVIRINESSQFNQRYNFASRKLLKFAIGNITEEVVNQYWPAETVDLGSDHIVVFLSGNAIVMDPLIEVLEAAKTQIKQWTQIQVTVAVSGQKLFTDDLRTIYQRIHELTMLKFISGEDKVFIERDLEDYMQRAQPLDDQLLDELIKQVRLGRPEEVTKTLDHIFTHMHTMHYTQSKFQLLLILYTLFKTFNKLPSVETIEDSENILESFDTLSGVRSWLENELFGIIDELSNRKSSGRREEIVTEIVDYVRHNLYDPMLTIEDIADHVSLSTRHVRQLFKDAFDQTLSDYILQERIARVKELLLSTDWPVTDVGVRAGFQTKSHFFTVFKKATGMTPSQFRELKAQ